jgi:hypothetical protein
VRLLRSKLSKESSESAPRRTRCKISRGSAPFGWFLTARRRCGDLCPAPCCVLLGIAGAVALRLANRQSSESGYNLLHNGGIAAVVVAVAVLTVGLIMLLVRLSRQTFYALVIETAGTPRGVPAA